MSEVIISTVMSSRDLNDFITFPWEVYKDDPYWVPPLLSERKTFLNKDENPFFKHAKADFFLARRNGKIVGTIAAFTNELYNEFQDTNVGFFGFFEVLEDPEAAEVLLSTAVKWAKQTGHTSIIGPAQFSTNDEAGLLVDGFDDFPRMLMTYNPPRYLEYLEKAGFEKAMDLWAYAVDLDEFLGNLPDKLVRVVEKVKERKKLTIRTVNMREFNAEVDKVKVVYNRSWEKNWGFVPFTDPEIEVLAKNLKPLIDPRLVIIVEKEDELVGFGLTLPDLNQPLHKAYPRPGTPEPFTLLKFLWNWKIRKTITWIRVWALGVLPEYRGTGVDAMLYLETARAAARQGIRWVEASWILENNDMMNRAIQMIGGKVYKTYRLFEKQIV
jgi:GNAT superfamily N-acetyltransferase